MRRFGAAIWAFLVRDTIVAISYRLEFALRLATVVFHVTALYFLSDLIGRNEAIDGYGGYLPFAALGLAVISITQAAFNSCAKAIHGEQLHGTLESLLLAPLRLSTIVVACSVWNLLWNILVSCVYVAAAVVLYDTELRGSLLLAALLLLLTTAATASLGIVSAGFVMVYKRGDPIAMLMGGVSFLLGGVFYPVAAMPDWLQNVAWCLPLTHGLEGIRAVLLQGAGVGGVWPQLVVLGGFVGAGLPLGLTCFRRAVRIAQRDGTLLQF